MVGLILAAGYATRLYPLTEKKSKCLFEVCGKPMLNYVLEKLIPLDQISAIYIVVNDKFYPDFEQWLKDLSGKVNCKTIELVNDGSTDNSNRLGAIGDISFVIKEKKIADDMVIVAGDNLFTDSLEGFVNSGIEKNKPLLGIYELGSLENVSKYSSVLVARDGKLLSFKEKPQNPDSSKIGIALYYYPKSVLPLIDQYIAENKNHDQPGRFVQWLYNKMDVYTYEIRGKWFDIGDLQVLQEAEDFLKSQNLACKQE